MICEVLSSISAATSWMRVRTIRFLSLASVGLSFGLRCSGYSTRLNDPEKRCFNCVVNAQFTKCDAAWFAVVEQTSQAGIARNVVLHAGIARCQLASAPLATNEADNQSVAMLGRSVMPTCVGTLSFIILRIAPARSQLT